MQHFGQTRASHGADHLLQTPDTFIRSPLPSIENGMAVVHIAPARGARFLQYTAELQADGFLKPALAQRFVYVLEGEIQAGSTSLLPGDYAYCPPGYMHVLRAPKPARVEVIEKPYQPLDSVDAPEFFTGRESSVPAEPLAGNLSLGVRCLIPGDMRFDFAVNTMTFQPGAALHMVEIHSMEHGLLILEGGGIYRLNDRWCPVTAGDFIWMAPYCPQWFGALGAAPTKYLIYKDWNR